jgi:hypothetical protein
MRLQESSEGRKKVDASSNRKMIGARRSKHCLQTFLAFSRCNRKCLAHLPVAAIDQGAHAGLGIFEINQAAIG